MNLFCFGLNHRTAPIEARERFAGHARSPVLLRHLGCSEVLLLTTCNRVEIYAAAGANIANEEIAESLRINDEPKLKKRFGGILSQGKCGMRAASFSCRGGT